MRAVTFLKRLPATVAVAFVWAIEVAAFAAVILSVAALFVGVGR